MDEKHNEIEYPRDLIEYPRDLEGLLRWLAMHGNVSISDIPVFKGQHVAEVTLDYGHPISLFDLRHVLEYITSVAGKRQKGHPHILLYEPVPIPDSLSTDADEHHEQYKEFIRGSILNSGHGPYAQPYPYIRGGFAEPEVPLGIYGVRFLLSQDNTPQLKYYYPDATILSDVMNRLTEERVVERAS